MDAVRLEPRDRRIATAVFGVATVALVLHACSFLPFIADDALISLRYADRFLSGHGLTWTDGERVEGYSNLLWILIVAAAGRLGMDLIVAARLLGVASMAAVLVALLRAHPAKAGSGGLPAWAACLGFALSAPTAVWAIGGLEQPLVAALLGWTITLALRLIEKVEPLRLRLAGTSQARLPVHANRAREVRACLRADPRPTRSSDRGLGAHVHGAARHRAQ